MKHASLASIFCTVIILAALAAFAAEDKLVINFEGGEYGGCTATGDAFGSRPLQGAAGVQKGASKSAKSSARTLPAQTGPLFTEDFNGINTGGNGSQWQTGLPLKHSANLPGWTKTGLNSIHAVEHTGGNWALQLVGAAGRDNTLTLDTSFSANVKGKTYAVSFDAGPSVWAAGQQATGANHQFSIELLRADDTVLARHNVSPTAWAGKQIFSQQTFTYRGDGSGDLKFRLSPVDSKGTYFHGSIDNLQVFRSQAEAVATVKRRLESEKRQLEETARWISKRTVLETDWLFQVGGNPTAARALKEITWARELADRLKINPKRPDHSAQLAKLDALEQQLAGPAAKAGDPRADRELYLAVRRVKHRIATSNPAIDFTQLLLIDQPYPAGGPEWSHEAIHRLGHRAVPGGRLLVLDGLHPDGQVRQLFPPKPGSFWRPSLSFDGKRVLFCFKPHDEKSFHLYEINFDGSGLRQLTDSDYDDIDPIYLPDGHIMFTTTRANSYVRCGPYIYSNVLARCDADGQNVYLISTNSEPDFVPALLDDGRVVYSRWEYSDKDQNRVQSLWTTNQNGTGTAVLWGNQSIWPDHLAEPRPLPNSSRVMFTGVGHHNWFNGSIGIIDPNRGTNFPHGLTRVTWDLPWGEVGNSPADRRESPTYHASGRFKGYLGAYPISQEDFLVSAKGTDDKFRVYLMDVHGNRELIYEGMHNAWYATPVRPRPSPPRQRDSVAWPGTGKDRKPKQPGLFYNADVYEGVPELAPGSVKYLRVFQQDAKTYSTWKKTFAFSGPPVSAVQTEAVKRIVSVVPVESDGSVYFEVPAGESLYFQLLDQRHRALHTMRSFCGVLPGERRGCVGCHKMHSAAPPNKSGLALRRPPTAVSPPPWGTESIGYERFVQPVLERYCGECHQGDGKARGEFDVTLRPASGVFKGHFKEPYLTLIGPAAWPAPVPNVGQGGFGLAGAFPVYGLQSDETYPNDPATDARSAIQRTMRPMLYLSFRSRLIELASGGQHYKAKVDPTNLRRLIAWVDANCPYAGEEEIRAMDDPEFPGIEQLPIRPRVKTAPVVERP
jgi:hypothetical protein